MTPGSAPHDGKQKIFVAMPVADAVKVPTVVSLLHLQAEAIRRGIGFEAHVRQGMSLIDVARNALVKTFLESDCTHLLFVDSDIGFPADTAFRMLKADRDVIGCSYPLRQLDLQRVRDAVLAGDPHWSTSGSTVVVGTQPRIFAVERGALEVDRVGCGCMMIKRGVLERLIAERPDRWFYWDGQRVPQIFRMTVEDHKHVSEDYGFCDEWRSLGGKVFALHNVEMSHTGTIEFRGNLRNVVGDPPPLGCRSAQCRTPDRCSCPCAQCDSACANGRALIEFKESHAPT